MAAEPNRTSILIVDDLPEKLLVYRSILEELGQELVTARSGAEALKLVLRQEFAVILLDVYMPGMDGFETATLIRQRKRSAHTPIIFLTAFADEVRSAQGYASGGVDYLPTPVVPDVLRAKVRVFVELFLLRQQVARQAEERALRAAAEERNRRLAFLAQAGAVLGRSLDFEATARDVVRLAVPALADVAVLALADRHGVSRTVLVARAGADGPAVEEATDLDDAPWDLAGPLNSVLTSGAEEFVRKDCGGADAVTMAMVLPLRARDRTIAALALSRGPSGEAYSGTDVTMAEAYASRAATALDNALLHGEVQRADRQKNDFLSMLAHELRNPLAPIRNSVQFLQLAGPKDPLVQQAREMIDRQVTHMTRLIDDLLDVSRISRGKVLLRKERCDLAQVVAQAVTDYRGLFEARGLTLQVDLPRFPVWVEGDPTRLAQVVSNLLHNAHKFTAPGGVVTVRLEADPCGPTAAVRIRDTGVGIDGTLLPRVFEVFAQGEQGLDRSRGGLGLGLALVKGLVELHGGDVSAASEGTGRGAEFTIRLPTTPTLTPDAAEADAEPNGKAYRILVIEDNHDAAESLKVLLTLEGHEVRTAHTGPTGLRAAQDFRPEVFLCDIGLPGGMDGYDVARAVRRDPALASAYVIALTGYGREEDQRRAREAGFDLHLTKPVDFESLRRALDCLATTA